MLFSRPKDYVPTEIFRSSAIDRRLVVYLHNRGWRGVGADFLLFLCKFTVSMTLALSPWIVLSLLQTPLYANIKFASGMAGALAGFYYFSQLITVNTEMIFIATLGENHRTCDFIRILKRQIAYVLFSFSFLLLFSFGAHIEFQRPEEMEELKSLFDFFRLFASPNCVLFQKFGLFFVIASLLLFLERVVLFALAGTYSEGIAHARVPHKVCLLLDRLRAHAFPKSQNRASDTIAQLEEDVEKVNQIASAVFNSILPRRNRGSSDPATELVAKDFLFLLTESETAALFAVIDKDRSWSISLGELAKIFKVVLVDRLHVLKSKKSANQIFTQLDRLLLVMITLVLICIFGFIFGLQKYVLHVSIGGAALFAALSLSGIIGKLIKSLLFILIRHSYDPGDRIKVAGMTITVTNVTLLSTIGKGDRYVTVYLSNHLISGEVTNYRRSGDQCTVQTLNLLPESFSFEKICRVQEEMNKFLETMPSEFEPSCSISPVEIVDSQCVRVRFVAHHRSNFADSSALTTRNKKFNWKLHTAVKRHQLEYMEYVPTSQ